MVREFCQTVDCRTRARYWVRWMSRWSRPARDTCAPTGSCPATWPRWWATAATTSSRRLHRGLPSAHLTFIFSLADPVVSGRTPEHARSRDPFRNLVLLGGLHQAPAYVLPDERQRGVQISVHPLAARALFGAPARELSALVTDGPDVLGADAERVRGRMREEPSWPARFAILQDYLRDRIDARPRRRERVRPELVEAWRWLAWHRGDRVDGRPGGARPPQPAAAAHPVHPGGRSRARSR